VPEKPFSTGAVTLILPLLASFCQINFNCARITYHYHYRIVKIISLDLSLFSIDKAFYMQYNVQSQFSIGLEKL